jgi:hypothetical protein
MATTTLTFTEALAHAEVQARTTLPSTLHERLAAAVALVTQGQVFQDSDGTWLVHSTSRAGLSHTVNGTCGCEDAFYRAPQGLCKHRISVYLYRRALQLMHAPQPLVIPEGPPPEVQPDSPSAQALPEAPSGIDPRHVVTIQGKPFIKYAGLLQMASGAGLQSLTAHWTYNDPELSLAHAVATFQDGRRFEESADSTPANVGTKVALHFRRLSLTRAKARALRDALNVDLVALEELGETE